MKKLLIVIALATLSAKGFSQDIYQYYFIEGRPTGKMQIEVNPEKGTMYPDIDSLVVEKREVKKNGDETYVAKKYTTLSNFFNALAGAGLEFVNYYKWNTVGGGTAMISGTLYTDYFIFRKKVVSPTLKAL